MEARRVATPPIGLYPYPEHAPPFVPPWLQKPPVIVLPVIPDEARDSAGRITGRDRIEANS